MIIPTNLIADPEIIKGLLDGSLVRYGSVIRKAAGTSQGGQIVRHLTEVSGLPSQLMTLPFSSILGFSQIAAGASVLNLGVSIAGFAYMGFKLHQVQNQISNLQHSVNEGFDRIDWSLEQLSRQLSQQLGYLYLLVEDSREEQQRLGNAIADLHKALLIKNIADLQAELEHLKRFPDDSPKAALKTATSARLFLASQATQAPLEFDANTLMLVDVSTQGWAVAIATEANLLLQHGQIPEAREVLAREIPRFQQHAHQWAKSLLNTERPELATAQRFATPYFKNCITPERVQRITQISPSDRALSSDQTLQKRRGAKVELEMTRTQPQLTSQWKYRQLAIAEYLDTLSELYARLDGLLAFAQLCEQQGVKSSHELLPDANAKPGLYLLPAVET
ncbi:MULTISPECIES: hypothetical protein [Spirulina sp. CCY15215]|uniref:hypothetical protein n=1 Tax=Spirulina sp. CCY15215 TaxID=2767591 RepID=UPI00194E8BD9|nr:hypothetical protein [Spirulina major]